MKLLGYAVAAMMCLMATAGTMLGQMSGEYTIDKSLATGGTNFATFAAAVSAINSQGVGPGGVTFTIASGTYTEGASLTLTCAAGKPALDRPVTFAVANGASVILNVTTTSYAISIGNSSSATDDVTVDGWNGTGRGLTINSSGPASGGIIVYGDACRIKNIIVAASPALSTSLSNGITISQLAGVSDNCLVENCDITSNYGVTIGTNSSPAPQTGNRVEGNIIHCVNRGIYANQSVDVTIRNNTVIGCSTIYPSGGGFGIYATNTVTTSGTVIIAGNTIRNLGINTGTSAAQTITAITAGSKGAAYSISDNRIYDLYNATSDVGGVGLHGIFIKNGDASSSYQIYNNMITGFNDDDPDATSNWTAGIRANSFGTVNIYSNSIYIKGTARNHSTTAILMEGNASGDKTFIKNNMLYCNQKGSASYKSTALNRTTGYLGDVTSDYNLLFNDGDAPYSLIGINSGDKASLANWQTTGLDLHSVCINPAAPFGGAGQWTSEADLHWTSKPSNSFAATVLGAPYTTDIDGDARDGVYPYMGADEIAGQPLPVELNSFTARVTAHGVRIAWSTATEANCLGFEIERKAVISGSPCEWKSVGFVDGAGTSSAPHSYGYTDAVATSGTYAYRMKQTDRNGGFAYYGNVEVSIGVARELRILGNYPNPFNPTTAIRFSVARDGQAEMRIFNALGQQIATVFNGIAEAGTLYEAAFDASALPSGLYFARLRSDGSASVMKMMLMK